MAQSIVHKEGKSEMVNDGLDILEVWIKLQMRRSKSFSNDSTTKRTPY